MNQLFTFNSHQFDQIVKSQSKQALTDNASKLFRSKRLMMRRYEQVVQRQALRKQEQSEENEDNRQGSIKKYLSKQISNGIVGLQPKTLQLLEKKQPRSRCQTESNRSEQPLLFTFYEQKPAKNVSQQAQKKAQMRSFSFKNNPVVDYTNSKILPKVFRAKQEQKSLKPRQATELLKQNKNKIISLQKLQLNSILPDHREKKHSLLHKQPSANKKRSDPPSIRQMLTHKRLQTTGNL